MGSDSRMRSPDRKKKNVQKVFGGKETGELGREGAGRFNGLFNEKVITIMRDPKFIRLINLC